VLFNLSKCSKYINTLNIPQHDCMFTKWGKFLIHILSLFEKFLK